METAITPINCLSEIPFQNRDFLIALLGFNFGVDFGNCPSSRWPFLPWAGFVAESPFPTHLLSRG
jgi:hypothetical protein